MANPGKRRGGRSRKRRRSRPAAARGAAAAAEAHGASAAAGDGGGAGARSRARGSAGVSGAALALGERPRAPWHPLPLSELMILVGAIGTLVGLGRGVSRGAPVLLAGLAAVLIGTAEVTLREHLGGYRSHAVLLSLLACVAFHSVVVLVVGAFTPVPRAVSVGLLAPDLALFSVLYRLLRLRYAEARRQRVFAGER